MTLLIISHMHDVMLHLVKNNPSITKVYLANLSLADKIYYEYLFKKHKIAYESVTYQRYSKADRSGVYDRVRPLLTQSIEYLRLQPNSDMSKMLEHYANLYLNFETFFQKYHVDVTCTWNGQRIFDLIINDHAKRLKKRTLFYEMGLFRPNTLTMDGKGVNIHNSVVRDADFYRDYQLSQASQVPTKVTTPSSSAKFYKLYKTFDHLLARLQYKSYKRFDNLYKVSFLSFSTQEPTVTLSHFDKEYLNIFCPFQVSHDTQVLLNSPHIKSMEAFLDLIEKTSTALIQQNRKVRFYIKAHPLEKRAVHTKADENIFVLDAKVSSTEAVKMSNLTLTINSTVGLEAVAHHKPCITLAETFYAIRPIAFYSTPKGLVDMLDIAIKEHDVKLQQNFIAYLKDVYQLPYNPFEILSFSAEAHHQKFRELVDVKS